MREYLHHITLRHWDSAMRTLGAVTLKNLVQLGAKENIDDSITREVRNPRNQAYEAVEGASFS
jgi:hypothetical protein